MCLLVVLLLCYHLNLLLHLGELGRLLHLRLQESLLRLLLLLLHLEHLKLLDGVCCPSNLRLGNLLLQGVLLWSQRG